MMLLVNVETLLWAILGAAIACAYMFAWTVFVRRQLREYKRENERLKKLVDGSLAPGWWCPKCGLFNGDVKVQLEQCRGCGGPRP